MTTNVTATPIKLSWSDNTIVQSKIKDSNDNKLMDAVTAFNYNIPEPLAKNFGMP